MNHFKHISHRNTWCQLKRLQSSLPASDTLIKLPTRIKREPTDILEALGSTIPDDPKKTNYAYHDDPFLFPMKRIDYRNFVLAYEAGKKAAMWIHKEHQDLFPKHLSEPEVKEFAPPVTYKDKDQVSEEILLRAISEYRISDALDIYKLLEAPNVSNRAKQSLLELLCFYSDEAKISKAFPFEHWYNYDRDKLVWRYNSEASELYLFLITQDFPTAVAAYNAMICGLIKQAQPDEAWALYEECKAKNVPLNVTTYNQVLILISQMFAKKNASGVELMMDVLTSMDKKGIKPNVGTLNAALKVITQPSVQNAKSIAKHLLMEFRKINIEFSLATYYYTVNTLTEKDKAYKDFVDIITAIEKRSYAIEDPMDIRFFPRAMHFAHYYKDRKIGDTIHALLLTGNTKFLADALSMETYYNSYLLLLLATSTASEFFQIYDNLIPHRFVPDWSFYIRILGELALSEPTARAQYLPKLWSDINTYTYANIKLKTSMVSLIKMDSLPADSPLKATFVDVARSCWNDIQKSIQEKPETYIPVETATIGDIVSILLHNDCIGESTEILTRMVEEPQFFVPTMSEKQVTGLFETCISRNSIPGAFRLLEYCVNFGFSKTVQMATKLNDALELTDADRGKLGDLVGVELPLTNTSKSS